MECFREFNKTIMPLPWDVHKQLQTASKIPDTICDHAKHPFDTQVDTCSGLTLEPVFKDHSQQAQETTCGTIDRI